MHPAERIQLWISYLIKLSILIALGVFIWEQNWLMIAFTAGIFLLTFLPAAIERNYKVNLPTEMEFAILLFIYASLFLGEINAFYTRFWWWDSVLHGASAVLLGIVGFLIVFILNYEPRVKLKMSPRFVAIFSFAFAVAIGAVWEIFEFAMDSWFGMNMQKSGLVDTMWDLIIDSAGALLASLAGYLYIKHGKVAIFSDVIERFIKKNPHMFTGKKR